MPTGLTYYTLQSALVVQVPTVVTDPNFVTMLPLAIDYAEQRIYRDLDFLATYGISSLGSLGLGVNTISVPSNVIELLSVYYGTLNVPVPFASLDYINMVYGAASSGPPEYVAYIGTNAPGYELYFGPTPDQSYTISYYGSYFPAALSADNPSTWLSQNLPDLLFAACMVWMSGYLKNYGASGTIDDPGMGMSWEKQYELLKTSAMSQENRRKFKTMMMEAPKNG